VHVPASSPLPCFIILRRLKVCASFGMTLRNEKARGTRIAPAGRYAEE